MKLALTVLPPPSPQGMAYVGRTKICTIYCIPSNHFGPIPCRSIPIHVEVQVTMLLKYSENPETRTPLKIREFKQLKSQLIYTIITLFNMY